MKKERIQEPILDSFMLYVYDCTAPELRDWVLEAYEYDIGEMDSRDKGQFIHLDEQGTDEWIVWANNPVSLAHEIIHFACSIFGYHDIEFNDSTEELFCRLHTYYFGKCLEIFNKEEKKEGLTKKKKS